MSLVSALSRISEIQSQMGGPPPTAAAPPPAVAGAPLANGPVATGAALPGAPVAGSAVAPGGFAAQLAQLTNTSSSGGSVGDKIAQMARQELAKGVKEWPPGSNNSPDIARYRGATQGAMAGAPWCAYFVSYLAKEAGAPIGPNGSGLGYVPTVQSWAQQTGRWVRTQQGAKPGDLVVFNQHIGVVDRVNPDGTVTTIEGNHSNRVDQVTRKPSEILGYVRLG